MYSKEEFKKLKTDFWTGFSEFCTTIPEISMRKPFFMLYDTKMKGIELKFDLRRDSVDVALEVNSWGRKEQFEKIVAFKMIFSSVIDELKLIIDKPENISNLIIDGDFIREGEKKVSRIYVRLCNIDFHRKEYWQYMYLFMAQAMIKMEDVFFDVRDAISTTTI